MRFVLVLACVFVVANSKDGTESVRGSTFAGQQRFLPKLHDVDPSLQPLDGEPPRELYYQRTRHKSWFQRMKNAFIEMGVGFVLLVFSLPVIWTNEERNAQLECVISCGERDCIKGEGTKAQLVTQRGSLIHSEGEQAKACGAIKDSQFDVKFDQTLRLKTHIDVYQWIEERHEEEKEEFGGGKTTVTTYTYKKDWSSNFQDGSGFGDTKGHENTKPVGLREVGMRIVECERIDYGQGHILPQKLVQQLKAWKPADNLVGKAVQLRGGNKWETAGDTFYYSRKAASTQPQVGDARVQFMHIPDGPVTVVALQVECPVSANGEDTFAPYRLVSRGCCGGASEDDVKHRLIEESKLSYEVLAERSQWHCGPLSIFCCACNIVNSCFAQIAYPEIFHAWDGARARDACFQDLREQASGMKWGFRLGGWFMMYAGMCMVFSPLITMLAVIPFLSHCSAYIVCFFCFIASVTISCVLMCMAYMAYHPIYAMIQLLIVAAVAGAANYLFYSKAVKKNA